MKRKIISIIILSLLIVLIICKYIFADKICGFCNICEWITYLLIVPTIYIIMSFFVKKEKLLKSIFGLTLGIIIGILLNTDLVNSLINGFVLHKLAATITGFLTVYLIEKMSKK